MPRENGTSYPINAMLTPDISFNETAYEEYGAPYVSTQVLWSMFFDYAAYASALSWMALFGFKQMKNTVAKLKERATKKGVRISEQYDDQLSIMQRSYEEVPLWWFIALFLASFISLLTIVATNSLYIPVRDNVLFLPELGLHSCRSSRTLSPSLLAPLSSFHWVGSMPCQTSNCPLAP